ncbi:phosphoglucosamine mutase [Engelhardtia mirabilis]|uniref:Phosphoglucosamine mutase n=1 Tax=Engelhardtia mirabilis TaxID=2528011 RepID=A0A518BNH5_9BACT|nr:Phosphoglucosamine mutase [Planctomycetes bacterium Pla133]QDV02846.1 Phosphoglucosamine mutase [Planctomycetes bacterium Pla86]
MGGRNADGRPRLFGTDGIRGRAGEGWLREDRAAVLGRAVAAVLGESLPGTPRALIGHDGRRSGPGLLAAIGHGMAEAGFHVDGVGLITTPGLAVLTRDGDYAVGVMISASHNPAHDNGIKIFDEHGGKLGDDVEDAIQRYVEAHGEPVRERRGARHGEAVLESKYVEYLLRIASDLDLSGLRIVLDCANGGGSHVAPRTLEALGADLTLIAADPDGDNINRDCGSTKPQALQAAVIELGADLGVALDGDGDRCVLVDERGELVDGDAMLTLLAIDAKQRRLLTGDAIVATVMSNKGLHKALSEAGVGVHTVGVGDRRVVEGLRQHGLSLGGEQSGHVLFEVDQDPGDQRPSALIGDGTLTALRVMAAMRRAGTSLSTLAGTFRAFPQVLVNQVVADKPPFEELPGVLDEVRRIESELGDEGRVLLRYSGTESLARVMVEGPDEALILSYADGLAAIIAARIADR